MAPLPDIEIKELTVSKLRILEEDLYVTQRVYDMEVSRARESDALITSVEYQNRMGRIAKLWWQLLELEDEIKKETTNAEENK